MAVMAVILDLRLKKPREGKSHDYRNAIDSKSPVSEIFSVKVPMTDFFLFSCYILLEVLI